MTTDDAKKIYKLYNNLKTSGKLSIVAEQVRNIKGRHIQIRDGFYNSIKVAQDNINNTPTSSNTRSRSAGAVAAAGGASGGGGDDDDDRPNNRGNSNNTRGVVL